MKVLHIVSAPAAGGAEVFVKDLVKNSSRHLIESAVLFISSAEGIGRSIEYQKKFLSELDDHSIPYKILPHGARRNFFKGRRSFKVFHDFFKPDCIHAHLITGIVYSKISRAITPVVYTHHSSVIETNTLLFRFLMLFCSAYIGISQDCFSFFKKYIPPGKKSKVIYNSIDRDRLGFFQKTNSINKQLVIISVGRVSREKNYILLLRAVHKVKTLTNRDFKLKIVGDGDQILLQELEKYVEESGLSSSVEFLGNRSDIGSLLNNADIFVMSSLYEGFPISLLEAQSQGLASIVTNVGGCKELLDITKGGVAVIPNSVNKLAEEITRVLDDDEYRAELGRNAESGAGKLSMDSCILNHKDLYRTII